MGWAWALLWGSIATAAYGVTAGNEIPETDPLARAVVRLDGATACTGTFLSPTTLLTAAHCVGTSPHGAPEIAVHGVPSRRVFVSPRFAKYHGPSEWRYRGPHDVAIAVFGEKLGDRLGVQAYFSLADRPSGPGIPVRFLGYGETSLLQLGGAGIKREGRNAISTVSGGLIGISGTSRDNGAATLPSGATPGDSGGPLLDPKGKILGVISYTESVNSFIPSHWTFFADALAPSSLDLYRSAVRCTGDACADDFGGSRVSEPPVPIPPRECLDPSEGQELGRLSRLWEIGELAEPAVTRFAGLRRRFDDSGECEEADLAAGLGCLRQAEMLLAEKLASLALNETLPAPRLARLKRILQRQSTWSYCLVP